MEQQPQQAEAEQLNKKPRGRPKKFGKLKEAIMGKPKNEQPQEVIPEQWAEEEEISKEPDMTKGNHNREYANRYIPELDATKRERVLNALYIRAVSEVYMLREKLKTKDAEIVALKLKVVELKKMAIAEI